MGVLFVFLVLAAGSGGRTRADDERPREDASRFKLIQGWVIGYDPTETAVILHTGDGGSAGVEQGDRSLRTGFIGLDISAVDGQTAWAVSLGGTVLHTESGGARWKVVEHPWIPITQVNRMDVLGLVNADIRIVDFRGGRWRMIHSPNNGRIWSWKVSFVWVRR